MDLEALKWDSAGLVTVVVQDRHTGEVRMVAHANAEAVRRTIETGEAHFFSRSRQSLWRKGETSGHTIAVREVWADCDGDALLYLADPVGPSCHTGERACFFQPLEDGARASGAERGAPTFARFWDTLMARTASDAAKSYTRSLLDAGVAKIADKVREEADELARALLSESEARVVSEANDLVYHAAVGLLARSLTWRDVEEEIARRFGRSGHDEKRSR